MTMRSSPRVHSVEWINHSIFPFGLQARFGNGFAVVLRMDGYVVAMTRCVAGPMMFT